MRAITLAALLLLAGCAPAASQPPTESASTSPAVSIALLSEMRDVPIAMYMTEWCPVCQKARQWLQHHDFAFVEHDVETDVRAGRILRQVNPRGSVPTFDIDGRFLIGFSAYQLRAAIREAALQRRGGLSSRGEASLLSPDDRSGGRRVDRVRRRNERPAELIER
jgi:glutaredoxin